jgi:hypothetical protein
MQGSSARRGWAAREQSGCAPFRQWTDAAVLDLQEWYAAADAILPPGSRSAVLFLRLRRDLAACVAFTAASAAECRRVASGAAAAGAQDTPV